MATPIPGVESAEWLNDLLAQMWPYIGIFTSNTLKQTVEPMFKDLLPGPLQSLHFRKISLGENPIRISNVDVHSRSGDTIKLDMDVNYDGDCDIELALNVLASFGVEKVKFNGRLSIILRPLVSVIPLVAAVQVAFISRPQISLDFTGAANIADLSIIDHAIRACISNVVASMMVLPERFLIKLDPVTDFFKSYYAHEGVLRFTIKSGKGFKTSGLIIKDKPDVYCITKFGAEPEFKTEAICNTDTPEWNASADFLLTDVEQEIHIEVWEKDIGRDDYAGNAQILVKDLLAPGGELTVPLFYKDGKLSGSTLTLSGKRLSFVADKKSFEASDVSEKTTIGYMTVIVASAKKLPKSEGMSTSVKVTYGDYEQTTHSVAAVENMPGIDPANPYWDKAFEIPLTKKRLAAPSLSLTVQDDRKVLGTVTVEIATLMASEGYLVAKEFDIGGGATLRSKVVLRGLAEAPLK